MSVFPSKKYHFAGHQCSGVGQSLLQPSCKLRLLWKDHGFPRAKKIIRKKTSTHGVCSISSCWFGVCRPATSGKICSNGFPRLTPLANWASGPNSWRRWPRCPNFGSFLCDQIDTEMNLLIDLLKDGCVFYLGKISWSGYSQCPNPVSIKNSGQIDIHPQNIVLSVVWSIPILPSQLLYLNWNRCRKHGTQWRYPQPRAPVFYHWFNFEMVLVHCCIWLPNCNMQPRMSALKL